MNTIQQPLERWHNFDNFTFTHHNVLLGSG